MESEKINLHYITSGSKDLVKITFKNIEKCHSTKLIESEFTGEGLYKIKLQDFGENIMELSWIYVKDNLKRGIKCCIRGCWALYDGDQWDPMFNGNPFLNNPPINIVVDQPFRQQHANPGWGSYLIIAFFKEINGVQTYATPKDGWEIVMQSTAVHYSKNNPIHLINGSVDHVIGYDGRIHVVADYINRDSLVFTCPFCWSRYKKDGFPTKNAKKGVRHEHQPGPDSNNRIVYRTPHCHHGLYTDYIPDFEFAIWVTNKTVRC